jgi:hypothetical protein
MITLYIFTEEASAKNVFEALLPKMLPENVFFQIFPHQGKQDLEKALRTTLPSISKMPGARILITRDQDSDECKRLKSRLQELISGNCSCPHKIRIICRELEAWFLGDLNAVQQAFPRFTPANHQHTAALRDVDAIQNPHDLLRRIIPEYSNLDTLPKIKTAESIAPFLAPENNSSTSYSNTINAIKELIEV